MAIGKDAIREHIRGIIKALGDDPEREGLKNTIKPFPSVRSFLKNRKATARKWFL